MTTPANLTYTAIETRVANQLRIPTSNTTETAKIAALINEVYRDIYVKQDWHFLVKRAVINTTIVYEGGTASVGTSSVGVTSTSVTLSSAPSTGYGAFTDRSFYVTGNTADSGAIYRISSHTAGGTAVVLDAGYTGAQSTAAAFKVWQDTYSLAGDVGKLLKVKRFGREQPLWRISPEEMGDLKTRQYSRAGKPEAYTVLDFATTGDPTSARSLVLWPFPDDEYRLEYFYKQQLNTELSSTTQPFLPDEYRQILVYGALARGYPIFLADTERGLYFQGLFNDMLNLMTANHREYTQDRPQFAPREADRTRFAQRRGTRTSLGSYFDIFPSEP